MKLKILKAAIIIIGSVIFINAIFVALVSNFNMGIVAALFLGAVLLMLGIFYEKIYKWLKIALSVCICIAVVFSSALLIYGYTDTVNYNEDALIVLGAAVHGDTPSLVLKDRLDVAVKYHSQNPDAIIVVSGGMGSGENISEAEAMEKYLITAGVPADIIIKEPLSTSTYENFTFSDKILKERFEGGYTAAFITNEYHTYRAGLTARDAGYSSISHLHSNTRLNYLIPGVLRECMAVIKVWIFGY